MSSAIEKRFFFTYKYLKEIKAVSAIDFSKLVKISIHTINSYDKEKSIPSYKNLIKISECFGVSIDYLLMGSDTPYIRNIELFSLAEKIDKLLLQEMAKVESYIDTFLDRTKKNTKSFDTEILPLVSNFNVNFKQILLLKKLTATEAAAKIGVTKKNIENYKHKTKCPLSVLKKISECFNVSMHWLLTGKRLSFEINNANFKSLLFSADEYLSHEHLDTTVKIMKQILQKH